MAVVNPPAVLQAPLFSRDPLDPNIKQALLSHIWPLSTTTHSPQQSTEDFEAYFTYFRQECRYALLNFHAIESFADMVLILDIIRDNPSSSLANIRTLIKNANTSLASGDRKLSASIELVVRLWLMINVRILMPTHRRDLEVSIPWPDNQSLMDILDRHICQPSTSHISALDTFSSRLNVTDMKNIANFNVYWTDNLSDHLTTRGSSIYLFYHVSVLKRIKASVSSTGFLPSALIDETLTTLNLLIPHSLTSCNTWLKGEISRLSLDPDIMYRDTADRNKGSYTYWQERLFSLSDAFDRTKPSSPIQWWYDRRDMGQWWGFWLVVAGIVLTVSFGLIQSITGILQVIGH
ncbi:hypothetical protein EDB81DRAFT_833104 [Dactylonectria macrodidyma]|uniref:Uncharacterized protein n=1 Tax=Dactylonectria macrodidyma TaxID=307937 RepID=A0A9P9CZ77_9HYPO|nr:hypothetical protein EDB81DRAFT_833104 [Dactylonectria macrodidyma]